MARILEADHVAGAVDFFGRSTANQLAAESDAGVKHLARGRRLVPVVDGAAIGPTTLVV